VERTGNRPYAYNAYDDVGPNYVPATVSPQAGSVLRGPNRANSERRVVPEDCRYVLGGHWPA